jgi:hypothetical protein
MARIVGRRPIELKISDQLNGYIPVFNSTTKLWGTINKNDLITGSATTSGSNIFSGDQTISGSLTVTQGITGSLFGTASYATSTNGWNIGGNSFGVGETNERILGTLSNHDLVIYASGSRIATFNTSGSFILGPGIPDPYASEKLLINAGVTTSYNLIKATSNVDNYAQINVKNLNSGSNASSDIVATANDGSELGQYINMGINSSTFEGDVGDAHDAYLYSTGNDLHIGNASNFPVQFFAGGLDNNANKKLQLNPNNSHQMTGSLDVSGSVVARSFTGSLQGASSLAISASFAATASSADNFLVRGTLTAQTIVAQTITSSIEFITGSTRNGSLLSNTHQFTGSISVTGSLAVNGSPVVLTNQTGSMSVASASVSAVAIYVNGGIFTGSNIVTSGSYAITATSASYALSSSYWSGSIINATSASYALTASYWSGSIINAATASYVVTAQTASYVVQAQSASYWSGSIINAATASYVVTAQTASYAANAQTASYVQNAQTASYVLNAVSSSFTATASSADNFLVRGTLTAQTIVAQTITSSIEFVTGSTKNGSLLSNTHQFTGSVLITGSLNVNGSDAILTNQTSSMSVASASISAVAIYVNGGIFTGSNIVTSASYAVTATSASNALTASYWSGSISNATSASYAVSSSYATQALTASNANTASYVVTAQTASYVVTAQTASYIVTAQTASYVLNAVSASFASTASSVNPLRQTIQLTGSLLISSSAAALQIQGSGSNVFSVDGTSGRLFSVDDSLSGSLFSVNTAAGLPVIEAFSDNTVRIGQFGQKALFVSSSRVGIGKEAPMNANLDISGSAAITGSLAITGSITTIGTDIVTGSLRVTGSLNVNNSLYVTGSNVGINNPLPSQSLDVLGNIRITNPGANGLLEFYNNTAVNGGPSLIAKIIGGREVNDASGYLGFFTANNGSQTEWIRLSRNGNLSIGKTTANTPLDILGNTTITGSLTVTGSSSFTGSVNVSGSLTSTGTITAQTLVVQTITSSVEFVTGSTQNGSLLTNTHQFTGSVSITGSLAVNGSSAILTNQTSSMSVATASYVLQAVSASFASNTPGISNGTASNAATASYVIQAQSASYWSGSIINAATASYVVTAQTASYVLQAVSSSFATLAQTAQTASYVLQAVSASFASFTPGISNGTASNAATASYVVTAQTASYVLNAISASYAATASSADNFTVRGTLTAQTINVQTITSSIEFNTGSTRNGSLLSNTHEFTGSVLMTGSLTVNNNLLVTGSVTAASAIARSTYINPTLVASANSDTLVGLDINPTFTNGAFTGVQNENLLIRGGTNPIIKFKNAAGSTTWGQFGANASELSFNAQAGALNFAAGNTQAMYVFASTRNFILQNGGTFTDAGYRLDVSGSTRLNGAVTVASASIQSQNTSSLASGTQTISTNATASFTAAFYNYTLASGSNTRAGQFIATWNDGSIQYMDNSTVDIGSTLPVALTASLSGANVLLTSTLPSTGWTIKTLVNLI